MHRVKYKYIPVNNLLSGFLSTKVRNSLVVSVGANRFHEFAECTFLFVLVISII